MLLLLPLTFLVLLENVQGQCQNVTTQADFDLSSYIDGRWYSQAQRPSPFQPVELHFCTTADYSEIDTSANPSQADYNEAYEIKVFNTAQDANGTVFTSDDESQVGPDPGPLCGLQPIPDDDPAKLLVGMCFEDPTSQMGGDYWVLAYDETEGYALISAGQPDVPTEDGLCSYSSPFRGAWIFTRDPEPDEKLIEDVREMAVAQGIDPSVLVDVNQENCTYPGAPAPGPPSTGPSSAGPPSTEPPSTGPPSTEAPSSGTSTMTFGRGAVVVAAAAVTAFW